MTKKWMSTKIMLCLILLAACSAIPRSGESVPASTQPATSPEDKPAASVSPTQSLPPPIADFDWEDRKEFAQTLSQSGQQSLTALPQASFYQISLIIPDDMSKSLTGWLQVRYFNQESHPLEEIYFRLFPNYYGGFLKVEDLEVDSLPVNPLLESGDTALRVDLAQPLAPGESLTIKMRYDLQLPETMSGNYGLLGFFEDVLVLDTFYPMIPAYDEKGWSAHYPYQNGDLTYTDASFYLVEVTAQEDLILASSGSVVEKIVQDGKQHLTIASGPARDFYLAGSKEFEVLTSEVDGITINSYALSGHSTIQAWALTVAGQALQIFNDMLGDYPYQEFDVVSSPMRALGIEYPGITGIYLDLYDEDGSTYGLGNQAFIESVIAHEVGHQWFYNLVGNDQQSEPWVDEALTQYITYQYFVQVYGRSSGSGIIQDWDNRWARLDYEKIPIGLAAMNYGEAAYSPIVYGRGPLFFLALEEKFGEEVLLEGLRDYAQAYKWKVANTEDLRESLEAACDCDLTEMFAEWIYPVE